jgi:hypothetical protein
VQPGLIEWRQQEGLVMNTSLVYFQLGLVVKYPLVINTSVDLSASESSSSRAWSRKLCADKTLYLRKRIQRSPVTADYLAGVLVTGWVGNCRPGEQHKQEHWASDHCVLMPTDGLDRAPGARTDEVTFPGNHKIISLLPRPHEAYEATFLILLGIFTAASVNDQTC